MSAFVYTLKVVYMLSSAPDSCNAKIKPLTLIFLQLPLGFLSELLIQQSQKVDGIPHDLVRALQILINFNPLLGL